MDELPLSFTLLTAAVALLTIYCLYRAGARSPYLLLIIAGWMGLTAALAAKGFFAEFSAMPPRMGMVLIVPSLMMAFLFFNSRTRPLLRALDPGWLTLLHTVRIPVELGLYYLFLRKGVPDLVTFEGYNFDILSGLTAPLMYVLVFRLKVLGRRALLLWNVGCLCLLVNVLTIAILSLPTPMQQLAFDQPNVAVAHFPSVWLPAVIVPLVLFSHLAVLAGAEGAQDKTSQTR